MNKLSLFSGLSVALIILIDLATGQGPAGLNSYLGPPPPPHFAVQGPPAFIQGPPTQQLYGPRGEYENKGYEKEGEKENKEEEKKLGKELNKDKGSGGFFGHHPAHPFGHEHEHGPHKHDKEYEKEHDKSTPAPGVLSSFSNSMNDAWKSLTSLGRQKRSTKEAAEKNAASGSTGSGTSDKPEVAKVVKELGAEEIVAGAVSSGRSIDGHYPGELRPYGNNNDQGYIFFKVPKNLICFNQY